MVSQKQATPRHIPFHTSTSTTPQSDPRKHDAASISPPILQLPRSPAPIARFGQASHQSWQSQWLLSPTLHQVCDNPPFLRSSILTSFRSPVLHYRRLASPAPKDITINETPRVIDKSTNTSRDQEKRPVLPLLKQRIELLLAIASRGRSSTIVSISFQ